VVQSISHKTPNKAAKIKIVISVFGKKIKIKNKNDLKLYSITNKFFLDWLSPKYPNIRVPTTLNNPIKAK
jgi:phosphatidylserine decarboxylase